MKIRSQHPNQPKVRRKVSLALTSNQRLVEYFCIISCQPNWKTDDTTTTAAKESRNGNIHLVSNTEEHTFVPKITGSYPQKNHQDNPLNPMMVQFCFPSGDVIVPSTAYELPRIHHFVMTNEYGKRVYGTCLTVCEEYTPKGDEPWNHAMKSEKDGIEIAATNQAKFYLPKVLCLLSTWPYLTAFREYLAQLYRLATSTDCMTAPIERYILNVCQEIPAPPPGAYEIRLSILNSYIRFWAPPAKLPLAYVALPSSTLFESLDIDNVLKVWHALVLERKVLLVSSQQSILTVVAETLISFLFPFRWSHLYVPLLPRLLCPMLDAPVPYLCGIGRDNWLYAEQHIPKDTMIVNLDLNKVTCHFAMPEPPAKKFQKLKQALIDSVGHVFWKARGLEKEYKPHKHEKSHQQLLQSNNKPYRKLYHLDHAYQLAFTPQSEEPLLREEQSNEDTQTKWEKAQEAFLRFFTALLKDYRRFLTDKFDRVSFVAAQKSENAPFLMECCMTQQFDDFITRKLVSPGEPDLQFFDQSVDAKLNRSKLKFRKIETPMLQSAKVHQHLKPMDALPPYKEDLDIDDASAFIYKYEKWPETLEEHLFINPRPIPAMISAEFDRQEMLVNQLRRDLDESMDDDLDLFGGECDASPEVASYTAFIFTYSAFVALDWHEMRTKTSRTMTGPEELKECESDEIEAVIGPEPVLSDLGQEAADSFVQDLTFGLIRQCPAGGKTAIKSTLVFVNGSPGNAYTHLVQQTKHFQQGFVRRKDINAQEDFLTALEEAREIAASQLDLAFETLRSMAKRDLPVDLDAYKSLMEACGRCGDSERATVIMNLIRSGGYVADPEIQSIYLSTFVHESAKGVSDVHSTIGGGTSFDSRRKPDAYAKFLSKQFQGGAKDHALLSQLQCHALESTTSFGEDSTSVASSVSDDFDKIHHKGGLMDWFSSTKKSPKRRRRKRRDQLAAAMSSYKGSDLIQKQIDLSEALLDYLYPGLKIDTSENCPSCSCPLKEDDIRDHWVPGSFYDYTTKCAKCNHRFVPKFVVSCSVPDFEGSQGKGSPLYCEHLSPWVLRKTLQSILSREDGIRSMVSPDWRAEADIRSTLFWNMVHMCRRYKFPFAFLLQGSFTNPIVLPRTPSEV